MADLSATFEAGVNGNDVLAADPGSATAWNSRTISAGTGTITYDNAHVYDALAGKFVSGTSIALYLSWTTALGTVTDHYGRLYLYMTAFPSANMALVEARQGATRGARIDITAAGKLAGFDNPAAALFTTFTASIALNQWVRIEWHIIHSATVGQGEVKLFNTADSATPTETKTGTANKNTLANADGIHFGMPTSSGPNVTFWLDNIIANAASYPGPVAVSDSGGANAGAFLPALLPLLRRR